MQRAVRVRGPVAKLKLIQADSRAWTFFLRNVLEQFGDFREAGWQKMGAENVLA